MSGTLIPGITLSIFYALIEFYTSALKSSSFGIFSLSSSASHLYLNPVNIRSATSTNISINLMSPSHCSFSHGCCTFTATSLPSLRIARCTYAMDAELIGIFSKSDWLVGTILNGFYIGRCPLFLSQWNDEFEPEFVSMNFADIADT